MDKTITKLTFLRKYHYIPNSIRRLLSAQAKPENVDKYITPIPPTTEEVYRDWYDFTTKNVLFQSIGEKGLITLNRPHASNALMYPMCKQIMDKLKEWESHKKLVVIEGMGDKAFCAGGDLTLLRYIFFRDGGLRKRQFFGTIYPLFNKIHLYKVPYVSIMDNITMGNGAGLSIHGKYRIVTERSIFSMPEVSLGFIPDGGCTYALPRLEGELGMFLGLTAHKLRGKDIVLSGIGTHYVPSEKLPSLKHALLLSDSTDVEEIIKQHAEHVPMGEFTLAPYMEKINECFSAPTVAEIVNRLDVDGSKWAHQILKTLSYMSPLSVKVAHRAFRKGKELSFDECSKMEFRLACTLLKINTDFYKGICAMMNRAGKPQWDPPTIHDVKMEDVIRCFDLLEPDKELKL